MTRAILLVDHGSRHEPANRQLHELAARLAVRVAPVAVYPCHMELASPNLAEAFAQAVRGGAAEVVVMPYFLAPGRHSTADIPALTAQAAESFPAVGWSVAAPLGIDERLLDLVWDRVSQTRGWSLAKPRVATRQSLVPGTPSGPSPRPPTLAWVSDSDQSGDGPHGCLRLLDQTRLPGSVDFRDCRTLAEVVAAIKTLVVRGAPAIGVAAAYGVVVGLAERPASQRTATALEEVCQTLAASRPTAVNLFWALDQMRRAAKLGPAGVVELDDLLGVAQAIHEQDTTMCAAIGRHGAELVADLAARRGPTPGRPLGLLTHCNAGALATAGEGTALGVIYAASRAGIPLRVFADETRPLLQGSRLTAWELHTAGVDVTVLCDNMAASLMASGTVDAVIVGADRIAANGDTANKIGTLALAHLAAAYGLPFWVAAPRSTLDLTLPDGRAIPIEQRPPTEVATHTTLSGQLAPTAPEGVAIYNPAFDVTPARLISALITERGLVRPVTTAGIAALVGH